MLNRYYIYIFLLAQPFMFISKGIQVHTLDLPRGKVTLRAIFRLCKLIKATKPDVVQTWMYHADLIGGICACLAGVKKVFWGVHHSNLNPDHTAKSTILTAKLCAALSRFIPTKIIYCAHKSRICQESIGYTRKKSIVIQNGYDVDRFKPGISIDENLYDWDLVNNFTIGNVGRYHPDKDHRTLIKALAICNSDNLNFNAIFVGTGLDENNSELLDIININCIYDKCHLLGLKTDIPMIMNSLDVFVLSSVSEAFPSVLNEAMACGIPCITTDVGDAAEIVSDTGWVVPPANPTALAQAITLAYDEYRNYPERWKERKLAARQRIEDNFSIEKMIHNYHESWSENA